MIVHQVEKQEYWGVAPKFTFVTSLPGVVKDQSVL